jgi:hypothetical protein
MASCNQARWITTGMYGLRKTLHAGKKGIWQKATRQPLNYGPFPAVHRMDDEHLSCANESHGKGSRI